MESCNYEGAIRSFERAQAPTQHHMSRLLSVISLVSFLAAIIITYRNKLPSLIDIRLEVP